MSSSVTGGKTESFLSRPLAKLILQNNEVFMLLLVSVERTNYQLTHIFDSFHFQINSVRFCTDVFFISLNYLMAKQFMLLSINVKTATSCGHLEFLLLRIYHQVNVNVLMTEHNFYYKKHLTHFKTTGFQSLGGTTSSVHYK